MPVTSRYQRSQATLQLQQTQPTVHIQPHKGKKENEHTGMFLVTPTPHANVFINYATGSSQPNVILNSLAPTGRGCRGCQGPPTLSVVRPLRGVIAVPSPMSQLAGCTDMPVSALSWENTTPQVPGRRNATHRSVPTCTGLGKATATALGSRGHSKWFG